MRKLGVALVLAFWVVTAFLMAGAMAGCMGAGSPSQKAQQTVAPDSTTAAKLSNVSAQALTLAQQNSVAINAIQKTQQNADAQIAKVAGNVDALTKVNAQTASDVGSVKAQVATISQNNFRFESWLAQSTRGDILHRLGVAPYVCSDSSDNPDSQSGASSSELGGVRSGVSNAGGGLSGRSNSRGGSARSGSKGSAAAPITSADRCAGAGADAKIPVLRKGPTMLELLIAFGCGVFASTIALIVLLAHHSAAVESYETKIAGLENGLLVDVQALIARIENKPKPPAAPAVLTGK